MRVIAGEGQGAASEAATCVVDRVSAREWSVTCDWGCEQESWDNVIEAKASRANHVLVHTLGRGSSLRGSLRLVDAWPLHERVGLGDWRALVSSLRTSRLRRGISQAQVAKAMSCSVSSVSRLESCSSEPLLSVLGRYAEALDVVVELEAKRGLEG